MTVEELKRRLARMPFATIDRHGWRHVAPGRRPESGEGAKFVGGRFNAPNSFPAVYVALRREVCGAEFLRMAAGQNMSPEGLLPRCVSRVSVRSEKVLNLVDVDTRQDLGIGVEQLTSPDRRHAQLVGELAYALGYDMILTPSATMTGDVAVVLGSMAIKQMNPRHIDTWFRLEQVPGWTPSAVQAGGVA